MSTKGRSRVRISSEARSAEGSPVNEEFARRTRAYPMMLFVTYSIRDGSEEKGYDTWLRRVDNPFFNAQPGVFHYSNWKIAGGANPFEPRTHFDFLGMTGEESFDPVWNAPEFNRFRNVWRHLWGVAPIADKAGNSQTYLCERTAKAEMPWGEFSVLLPAPAGETLPGWDTWRVLRNIRGPELPFTAFHVRFVARRAEFEALAAKHDRAMLATLIAAPSDQPE